MKDQTQAALPASYTLVSPLQWVLLGSSGPSKPLTKVDKRGSITKAQAVLIAVPAPQVEAGFISARVGNTSCPREMSSPRAVLSPFGHAACWWAFPAASAVLSNRRRATAKEASHALDQGRDGNLLQGLGLGPAYRVPPRLALSADRAPGSSIRAPWPRIAEELEKDATQGRGSLHSWCKEFPAGMARSGYCGGYSTTRRPSPSWGSRSAASRKRWRMHELAKWNRCQFIYAFD
jgi:hypothetical protein